MEFNILCTGNFWPHERPFYCQHVNLRLGEFKSLNKTLPGQIQDWMKLMLAYEEGRTKKMWGKNKPACMYTVFQVKRIEVGVDMRYN